MKKFKKLSLVIMLVMAFTFLMTACSAGSKIDTTLTINPDGTGNRKMSVQIDNQVFSQYFKGTYDNLEEVIKKNIPSVMKYEMKDTDGVKSVIFTIDFSSVEEYKTKIKTFGIENVKTDISIADGVWTKGISIEENYESKDLLKWLSDALVKSGYVTSDNASMIFTNSGTYLVYDGNQKNTYSRIQANDIEQVEINKIDVLTEVNAINNYNRTIIFDVPQASMDKRGAEIKAFFSKISADIKDEKKDFGTRFIISKKNLTYKDIEDLDKSVFGADNVKIEEVAIEDEFSPFTFGQLYNETINLSDFVLGRNSIKFNVFGKAEKGNNIYLTNKPSEMSYLRYSKSDEYPDYIYLNDYYASSKDMQVPILAVKSYVVDNMDINTSRAIFTENWTRKCDYIFAEDISEEDEKIIISRLNALVGVEEEVSETENSETEETSEKEETSASTEEEKSLGTVKFKTNAMGDGEHKITITQKGNAEEIKNSSEALYKISGKLQYAVDSGFWKIIKKQAFVDKQDYTYMLGATGEDFKINYTMKLNPTSWIEYAEGETEEYPQMKLGRFTAVVTDKNVDISYTGSKIDFIAVFFWLFLVGAIVCAVIMLIKMGIFKAKPKPSDAPQLAEKAQQIVQEYPPVEKPEPQSPIIPKVDESTEKADESTENIEENTEKADENTEAEPVADKTAVAVEEPQKTEKLCSKCGAKVGETSSFCSKCGAKIE